MHPRHQPTAIRQLSRSRTAMPRSLIRHFRFYSNRISKSESSARLDLTFLNASDKSLMPKGPANSTLEVRGVNQAEFTFYKEMASLTAGRTFPYAKLHIETELG